MKRMMTILLPALLAVTPAAAHEPAANEHGGHGVAADARPAKVTLVYEHALPQVPGKSVKGVLVEYGPGGANPSHVHARSALIYATVLEGAVLNQINGGPVRVFRKGENFTELPGDFHKYQRQCQRDRTRNAARGLRRRQRRQDPDHPGHRAALNRRGGPTAPTGFTCP